MAYTWCIARKGRYASPPRTGLGSFEPHLRALSLLLGLAGSSGCSDAPGGSLCGTGNSCQQDGDRDAAPAPMDRRQPPISGGTLLVTRDGAFAVAADPDVDQVSIVGMSDGAPGCSGCGTHPRLLESIELARGEEPGRLAEDGDGRVHVVLRRGGAIATIDLASGELLARRPVCAAPRGIAFDESANLLHIACASGELVSMSPLGGDVVRRIEVDVDLRDVVIVPDGLVVSRFKSAELIRIDHDGNVVERVVPAGIERGPQDLATLTTDPMEPAVAWRTVATAEGSVFMLHQYGLARPIELGKLGSTAAPPTPYTSQAGSSCGGIVAQTVSTMAPGGTLDMGMPLPVGALSVDVAASSDGAWLAVAHPGTKTPDDVTLYDSSALPSQGRSPVHCADNVGRMVTSGRAVAVALIPGRTPAAAAPDDWLVVQTRYPATLSFYNSFAATHTRVDLPVVGSRDPGHELFHADAGGGIACAQCHAEGSEDGRVWQFDPEGKRRTQSLNVGLKGTEPFHWNGNLATFTALVDEVFVRRMGGTLPANGVRDLTQWLGSLSPPKPIVEPDAPEAVRGRAVFESAGCPECHAGAAIAKNTNVDVGVESPQEFQIPALRGVGYRAPYLHNGCAKTLRDRFDPSCGGGDRHGTTSGLSSDEIDDLIAYLRSL